MADIFDEADASLYTVASYAIRLGSNRQVKFHDFSLRRSDTIPTRDRDIPTVASTISAWRHTD